jgi:hypothetical protein
MVDVGQVNGMSHFAPEEYESSMRILALRRDEVTPSAAFY